MRLLSLTKTVGITIKLVIEAEDEQARTLLESLPSDLTVGGECLSNLRIGARGMQLEPVRVAIVRDDMSFQDEDAFLENN